jgi:type VI protein secretion system component VasK
MSSSQPQQTPPTPSPWWSRLCRVGWIALRFFWVTIVFGVVLGALVSWFFSKATPLQSLNLWPILDWMQHHLFLTVITIVVLLGLTWLMWYGSRIGETATRQQSSTRAPTERDRTAFLHLLGKEYRKQLAQSLQEAVMMELGLQERRDVISSPTQFVPWPLVGVG